MKDDFKDKFKLIYKSDATTITLKFEEDKLDDVIAQICEFLRSIGYSEKMLTERIPDYPYY